MKFLLKLAVAILALGGMSVAQADPVLVGDKEWRQLTETVGFSWNEVATVCDPSTGNCGDDLLGGVLDLSDWVWASREDTCSLLIALTPSVPAAPPQFCSGLRETDSTWAPAFMELFEPTYSALESSGLVRNVVGWTRTDHPFSPQDPPLGGCVSFVVDSPPSDPDLNFFGIDNAFACGNPEPADEPITYLGIAGGGIWLYRSPVVTVVVTIDIKPGSERNPINLKANGLIPVAILTTETFDATQVDWETVQFGPSGATERHQRVHVKDMDYDGDIDVVLHFKTRDTGILCGDTEATLTGVTFSGEEFTGSDVIKIVKCPKKKKRR